MGALQPFTPAWGSSKQLVGAAGEVVQNYPDGVPGNFPRQMLLSNVGTVNCFVRVSRSVDTTAATVADLLVLPNTQVIVSLNYFEGFNVRLAAGATGSTLHAMLGQGF